MQGFAKKVNTKENKTKPEQPENQEKKRNNNTTKKHNWGNPGSDYLLILQDVFFFSGDSSSQFILFGESVFDYVFFEVLLKLTFSAHVGLMNVVPTKRN